MLFELVWCFPVEPKGRLACEPSVLLDEAAEFAVLSMFMLASACWRFRVCVCAVLVSVRILCVMDLVYFCLLELRRREESRETGAQIAD